jgi:short-subunit dehydrogenase
MCSVASLASYPNSASYTISKFALLGFSKALREEMKPFGVKVTAVIPGAVQTPSWGDIVLPENQIMPAEDIAEAVFMAFSLSKSTVIEELLIKPLA